MEAPLRGPQQPAAAPHPPGHDRARRCGRDRRATLQRAAQRGTARILPRREFAGYVAPGLPGEGGALARDHRAARHSGSCRSPWCSAACSSRHPRRPTRARGRGTMAPTPSSRPSTSNDGRMRARVPFVKLVASATHDRLRRDRRRREARWRSSPADSDAWYATFTGRDRDRRLLPARRHVRWVSAAIFRSPIGAALLSVEIICAGMETEPNALLATRPSARSSPTRSTGCSSDDRSFACRRSSGQLPGPLSYLWYVVLGRRGGARRDRAARSCSTARATSSARCRCPPWLQAGRRRTADRRDRARVPKGHRRRRLRLDAAGDRRQSSPCPCSRLLVIARRWSP